MKISTTPIVITGISSPDGISTVCRQYGVSTVQFYNWKDKLYKSAPEIFKHQNHKANQQEELYQEQIRKKDRVIAVITEENLQLKKNLGF